MLSGLAIAATAVFLLVLLWPLRIRSGFYCSGDELKLYLRWWRFELLREEVPFHNRKDDAEKAGAVTEQEKTESTAAQKKSPQKFTPSPPPLRAEPVPVSEDAVPPPVATPSPLPASAPESSDRDSASEEKPGPELRNRRLLQVLLTPGQEQQLMNYSMASGKRFLRIFHLRLDSFEVHGSLGDPYWNGIAVGLSQGNFYPDWENKERWWVRGELSVRLTGWRLIRFLVPLLTGILYLAWKLWRTYRKTLRDPEAVGLGNTRRWILNQLSPLPQKDL